MNDKNINFMKHNKQCNYYVSHSPLDPILNF